MKRYLTFVLLIVSQWCFAQVTSTAVNKLDFEKSDFPFKGVRVLMVENISTPTEENYYVFSKNAQGSEVDELYIEQFQKKDNEWLVVATETISEPNIVTSVWNNRKAFYDADKDGKADVLFIYSKHPKGNLDKRLAVVMAVICKGQICLVESSADTDYDPNLDIATANYMDLPEAVSKMAEDYWAKLDKK